MKKLFLFILLSTLLFANLLLEEKEYLEKKGPLKVCYTKHDAPFVIENNDKISGISIDFLDHITKGLDIKYEMIKAKSIKEKREFLQQNRCDILPMVPTDINQYSFIKQTTPLGDDHIVLVTNIFEPYLFDLKTLKNKKVAIRKGAINIKEYVKQNYPNLQIVEAKGLGLKEVYTGEVYGAIASSLKMGYVVQKRFRDDLKIMGMIGDKKVEGSLGVNANNKMLLNILNKSIDNIEQDKKDNILAPWYRVKVEKGLDPRFILKVFVAILVFIAVLFSILILYRRNLKKEIEKNSEKEKMMLHQSRLAQMGETISMIAHQWRQPLNTLSMLHQAIVLKHERDKLDLKTLENFEKNSNIQIELMSKTIDDFSDFFKPEKEKVDYCVNDVIVLVIDMLTPTFTQYQLNIKYDVCKKIYAKGFPNELGQALVNILNNAKDAFVENDIDDKKLEITLKQNDGQITLTISDNAGGILEGIIEKIFDPYFSTKSNKNGTGLGLYMTKVIIEEHLGGKISVENRDKGTCFRIILE